MAKKNIKFVNVLDEKVVQFDDYIPDKVNCWIHNLPDDKYFRLPKTYYSSSGIMKFFQPPGSSNMFKYIKAMTPALDIGSLVHAHLLAPEELTSTKMIDAVKNLTTRFPEETNIDGTIKPSAMDVVTGCVQALMDNDDIMDCLSSCDTELSGIVRDKYFGGSSRIKCDAIDHSSGILYDIKTSVKKFSEFKRSASKKNSAIPYYIQAAHYLMTANLINKLSGDPRRYHSFQWMYVSKKDYSTGIYECPPELIDHGSKKVREFYQRTLGSKFREAL